MKLRYVRKPVYAHTDASVPWRWVDVPEFLASGWTGDPPKDGGYVVPLSVDVSSLLGQKFVLTSVRDFGKVEA